MKKKIISIALCVLLVLLTLPLSAMAEDVPAVKSDVSVKESLEVPETTPAKQEERLTQLETESEAADQTVTENGTTVETKIVDADSAPDTEEPTPSTVPSTADDPSAIAPPQINAAQPTGANTSNNFTYNEYNGQISVTGYTGSEKKVEVPAELDGKPVNSVNLYSLNSVVEDLSLAEGIKNVYIQSCPFLKNIALPSTVDGYVTINNTGLENADGFKKAVKMTNLAISYTPIKDISGLSGLTALTNLSLDNNENLTDISCLKQLTNLTYLYLYGSENITEESKAALIRSSEENMTLQTVEGKKEISCKPQINDSKTVITVNEKFAIVSENAEIAKVERSPYGNWYIKGLKAGKTKAVFKYDGKATGSSFNIEVTGMDQEPDQPIEEKIENLPQLGTAAVPGGSEALALYDNGQLWTLSGDKPAKIMDNVKKYVGMTTYVGSANYASRSGLSWTMIEDNNGTLWTREFKDNETPKLNKRVENVVKYVGVAAYGSSGIVNGYALDASQNFWNLGGNNSNQKIYADVKDFDALGFNQSGVGVAVLKNDGELLVRVDPSTNAGDGQFVTLETGVSSLEPDERFIKDGALYAYNLNYNTKRVEAVMLGDGIKALYAYNSFAVKIEDGTTWYQPDRTTPTRKILDTSMKDYTSFGTNEGIVYYLLDEADSLYKWSERSEGAAEKVADHITYLDTSCYLTADGDLYDLKTAEAVDHNVKKVIVLSGGSLTDYCVLKTDNVVYRNGVALLNNVGDIVKDEIPNYSVRGIYMVRLDGTTWYSSTQGDPTPYQKADYAAKVNVTGVKITPAEAAVTEGYSTALKAVIEPANATNQRVSWKSSNPEVVTVDNGVVIGVKAGTAKVTATTEDGSKTAECSVTVKKAAPVLKSESGTAEGVVSGQTGQDFIDDLKENNIIGSQDQVQVLTADGKEADSTKPLATGMKIVITAGARLFNRDAAGIQEYTVVVLGDSTGDGVINVMDMLAAQDDILGKEKLEGCYRTAGDINKDNSINIMDMLAIQDDILGKEKINPYE